MTDKAKTKGQTKRKTVLLNIIFLAGSILIVVFLLRAPEETTAHLPHDATHEEFHHIESKKEAEKFCLACHGDGQEASLPSDHPPKYRCLFCHKRVAGER
jgi:cytochrome c553